MNRLNHQNKPFLQIHKNPGTAHMSHSLIATATDPSSANFHTKLSRLVHATRIKNKQLKKNICSTTSKTKQSWPY